MPSPAPPTKANLTDGLAQQLAAIFQQVLDTNPTLAKSLAKALSAQEPSSPEKTSPIAEITNANLPSESTEDTSNAA